MQHQQRLTVSPSGRLTPHHGGHGGLGHESLGCTERVESWDFGFLLIVTLLCSLVQSVLPSLWRIANEWNRKSLGGCQQECDTIPGGLCLHGLLGHDALAQHLRRAHTAASEPSAPFAGHSVPGHSLQASGGILCTVQGRT